MEHIWVRVLAWPERIWMCSWTPANAESSKGTGIRVVLQAQALTREYLGNRVQPCYTTKKELGSLTDRVTWHCWGDGWEASKYWFGILRLLRNQICSLLGKLSLVLMKLLVLKDQTISIFQEKRSHQSEGPKCPLLLLHLIITIPHFNILSTWNAVSTMAHVPKFWNSCSVVLWANGGLHTLFSKCFLLPASQ